jgi:UDP-GlcNAc:undecaprenyl-phosphate GlcNAc-1-phosphate transferase
MLESIIAPAIAFIATALIITLLIPLAQRIGLTDKPAERKQHAGEIPLIGGVSIYLGASIAIVTGIGTAIIDAPLSAFYPWFTAALLIVAVGSIDDYYELSPAIRFGAQIGAALIMVYWGGAVLDDLGWIKYGGYLMKLHWAAAPFTVFAAVGIINAINMFDGLDGLSGNLTLVTLLAFGIAESLAGNIGSLPAINIVSAAIAGFLLFNQRLLWRSKAKVFLGDAGSMMLGLFLVWGAVDISQGEGRTLTPAATLWFLAIPIFDTVRVMTRRILRGRSPFAADACHLHHLFVRSGWNVSETLAIICILAALGSAVGLIGHGFDISEFSLAVAFTAVGVLYYVAIERAWRTKNFLGRKIIDTREGD